MSPVPINHIHFCLVTKATLITKALNWGLASSFILLVHHHHNKEHDGMQEGSGAVAESYILIFRQRETGPDMGF